ncbi:MAG TPA: hypothetical protein DCY07_07540 [Rhodospirillaceae bacterium]|nr:hypothetical protein [Rhodospirillaceae bacterium]
MSDDKKKGISASDVLIVATAGEVGKGIGTAFGAVFTGMIWVFYGALRFVVAPVVARFPKTSLGIAVAFSAAAVATVSVGVKKENTRNANYEESQKIGLSRNFHVLVDYGTPLTVFDCSDVMAPSKSSTTAENRYGMDARIIGVGDNQTVRLSGVVSYKNSFGTFGWSGRSRCNFDLSPTAFTLAYSSPKEEIDFLNFLKKNNIDTTSRKDGQPEATPTIRREKEKKFFPAGDQTSSFKPDESGSSYSAVQNYDNFSRLPISGRVKERNFTCG